MLSIYEDLLDRDPTKVFAEVLAQTPGRNGCARVAAIMAARVKELDADGRYFLQPNILETVWRMNELSSEDFKTLGDITFPPSEKTKFTWDFQGRRVTALVTFSPETKTYAVIYGFKDREMGNVFLDCMARVRPYGIIELIDMNEKGQAPETTKQLVYDLTDDLRYFFILRHAHGEDRNIAIQTVEQSFRPTNNARARAGQRPLLKERRLYLDISSLPTNGHKKIRNNLAPKTTKDPALFVRVDVPIKAHYRTKTDKAGNIEKIAVKLSKQKRLCRDLVVVGGVATKRIMTNRHPERPLGIAGGAITIAGATVIPG